LGAATLAILLLGMAGILGPLCPAVQAQSATTGEKSWTESITSPFKQGFDKLGNALNPNPSPKSSASVFGLEDDAISLKNKAKPGPELFVAIARLYEQSGKAAEAEQQYQLALKEKPDHLPALLGYARLKDGLGKPNEAIQLYQCAANAYPRQALVHNNLGLCYARQSRLDEAAAALGRAVQLEPKNPLYRNNLATVLVDQSKLREAMMHLQAAHGNAAAYYNMGYLLNKKGRTQEALQHFAWALKADPSMKAARQWVDHLQKTTAQARLSQPTTSAGNAPLRSGEPKPRRLPPTAVRETASSDGPTLPGISYERPTAPLPPPLTTSALRPLPRVN
jgi:tetratricopeptide (TPR) repeat protein